MNSGRKLGDVICAGGNWRMEGRLRHSKGLSWARQLGNGAWGKDAWDLISASLCTLFCAHLGTLELTQKAFPYLTDCTFNKPVYEDFSF